MPVTVIIAAAEAMIRFGSDQGWPMPVAFNVGPAFLALAIVGPIAKFIDLRRAPVAGVPVQAAPPPRGYPATDAELVPRSAGSAATS